MPELALTRKIAEKILAELTPFCERLEIAGSIRRGRALVNDIDLVILPKAGQEAAFHERCGRNAVVVKAGPQNAVYRLGNGLHLDLWIAHGERRDLLSEEPTNYGSLLLCRTGSVQHNIYLVEHAKRRGLIWNPHHGVYQDKKLIASTTEQDVLAALDLPWIKPEDRER